MSELVVSFAFISLFVSIGVLWFVAEMTRCTVNSNKGYIDERFTGLLAEMRDIEKNIKQAEIAYRDMVDDIESIRMSQQHSAGKELAITASLKEVAKQINSLESMRKKATGTDG